MAENWVDMLLNQYPDFFKRADHVPGQEPRSPAQAYVAEPATSRKVKANRMMREFAKDVGTAGSEPEYRSMLPLFDFNDPILDCSSGVEGAALSRSYEDRVERYELILTKLADAYENSQDKNNEQTLLDLLQESSASSDRFPITRSISPPLDQALARRDSRLSYRKPGLSPLRNEIHSSPADNEKKTQQESTRSRLGTSFLNVPFMFWEKITDQRKVSYLGMAIDSAKFEDAAADAHKDGATERKIVREGSKSTKMAGTTPVNGAVVNEKYPPPSLTVSEQSHICTRLTWSIPAPTFGNHQPTNCQLRKPRTNLHDREHVRIASHSDVVYQDSLEISLNMVHDPMICKTVPDREQAGEGDKLLNQPNKDPATLAQNTATSSNVVAKPPTLDIFRAALHETRLAGEDPSYRVTTAREKFAQLQGEEFNPQFVERLEDLLIGIGQALCATSSPFDIATTEEEKRNAIWNVLASAESKAFDKGKSKESEPAIEDRATIRIKEKENEARVGNSTISQGTLHASNTGKGKGEKSKPAMNDMANTKSIVKNHDMLMNGSNIDSGKKEQSKLDLARPKRRKRKGKLKKTKMPTEDVVTGEGKDKDHEMFWDDSTVEESMGEESELHIKGSATEKGQNRDNELPLADTKVVGKEIRQVNIDLLREAQAVDLGPKCDNNYNGKTCIVSTKFDATASSAALNDPRVNEIRTEASIGFQKMYDLMEFGIRPQTASPNQLDLFCRFVEDPLHYPLISTGIDELKWNRAVVEHPCNPMITSILQRTAHLRPTDGLHHPSGISVAPLLVPQYPPLPPGPVPATPAVTTPTKKRPRKERPNIFKLRQARKEVKPRLEDALKELDLKEQILVGKMKTGLSQPFEEVFDEVLTIADTRRNLKEKARLEEAGGKVADRLAQRLKKMAEEDGVPPDLLPP